MKDHPNPMPRELFGDFMGHETLGEALARADTQKAKTDLLNLSASMQMCLFDVADWWVRWLPECGAERLSSVLAQFGTVNKVVA